MGMKVRIHLGEEGEPEIQFSLGMTDVLNAVKQSTGFNTSSISPFLMGVFDMIKQRMMYDHQNESGKKKKGKSK